MPDGDNKEKTPDGAPTNPDGTAGQSEEIKDLAGLKALAKQRDELKSAAEAERKRANDLEARLKAIEDAKVTETQKFKEAYEKLKPEADALAEFKKTYDARVESDLKEAEAVLSEELKEEYEEFVKVLPKEDRLKWLKKKSLTQPQPKDSPGSARPGSPANAEGEKPLSHKERLALYLTNKDKFLKKVGF